MTAHATAVRAEDASREKRQAGLIPALQKVQEEEGYLSRAALERISRKMGVPLSAVYGVATFYAQFHLQPRGRHIIRVCMGTACHVRGGVRVLNRLVDRLGIGPGETTPDGRFTLERVACLGACSLAPTMMIDNETFGRLDPGRAEDLLERYE